jgi:hypothetical protein
LTEAQTSMDLKDPDNSKEINQRPFRDVIKLVSFHLLGSLASAIATGLLFVSVVLILLMIGSVHDGTSILENFEPLGGKPSVFIILCWLGGILSAIVFGYAGIVFAMIRSLSPRTAWKIRRNVLVQAGVVPFFLIWLAFAVPMLAESSVWTAIPTILFGLFFCAGLILTMTYVYAATTKILFVQTIVEETNESIWPFTHESNRSDDAKLSSPREAGEVSRSDGGGDLE